MSRIQKKQVQGAAAAAPPLPAKPGRGRPTAADMAVPRQTLATANHRKPVRMVIADDHVLMRELLVNMMSQQGESFEVVAQVGTGAEAVDACRRFAPDVLVLDGMMPGMTGVEAVPLVKAAAPATRILLCCGSLNDRELLKALQAGAEGFMEKTNSPATFFDAVQRVSRGESYLCSKSITLLSRVLRNTNVESASAAEKQATLTTREKEIIGLIAEGLSSKEIATKLFLSLATVETHRANLMTKIQAHNVAQLVRYALDNGLVARSA
jgi:DNA-binding NarL/FixJ family response regulator